MCSSAEFPILAPAGKLEDFVALKRKLFTFVDKKCIIGMNTKRRKFPVKKCLSYILLCLLILSVAAGCAKQSGAEAEVTATLPNVTVASTASAAVTATPSAEPTLADVPTPTLPPITPAPTATVKPTPVPTPEPVNTVGNTMGNAKNGCYVTEQGSWIYYRNPKDGYKLYKIKKDGTQKTKITQFTADDINVVGDWLYYYSYQYDPAKMTKSDEGLHRIKTDGTQEKLLVQGCISQIYVVGDWIYYVLNEPYMTDEETPVQRETGYSIFKIKTDGTGKKLLKATYAGGFIVSDGWIYYHYNKREANDSALCKMTTDGLQDTRLTNESTSGIIIYNGWIYYNSSYEDYALYKIRTDGTSKTKVMQGKCGIFNIYNDWIYFSVFDESTGNMPIYRIKPDGTGRELFTEEQGVLLNFAGGWMYYMCKNPKDNYKDYDIYFRIRMDGTGREEVN